MKTWLITGCSSGFGQRLALVVANRGDQVVATARNVAAILASLVAVEVATTTPASLPSKACPRRWRTSSDLSACGNLPLGPAAHGIAERKQAAFRKDIDTRRDVSIKTDLDRL